MWRESSAAVLALREFDGLDDSPCETVGAPVGNDLSRALAHRPAVFLG